MGLDKASDDFAALGLCSFCSLCLEHLPVTPPSTANSYTCLKAKIKYLHEAFPNIPSHPAPYDP